MTPRFNEQFYDGSVGAQFLAPERQTMSERSSPDIVEALEEARRFLLNNKALEADRAIGYALAALRASLQPATPTARTQVCADCIKCSCKTSCKTATGGDAVARCICQDECRKGYCTEQGCPNNIGGDAVAGDVQAATVLELLSPSNLPMENDPDVLQVARAIAERGIGRYWDDFPETDAFDTDQGDLIEYARAAVEIFRKSARPVDVAQGKIDPATVEACAKAAEAQKETFLSPQYASNQPFGSLCERFACDEVAKAIRALALPRPPLCTPSAEEK